MPLYDFVCEECQNIFEEIASVDSCPPCPQCHSTKVHRNVSAPSPLKSGAFPFKVGPVHPMAQRQASSCPHAGGCASTKGFS